MAVTITGVKRVVAGNHKRIFGTITGPASYTTGGETLTANQIKQITDGRSSTVLTSIQVFESEVEPANLRSLVLDRTNLKILFTVAGAQVANATNLSAVLINFVATVDISNG